MLNPFTRSLQWTFTHHTADSRGICNPKDTFQQT